MLGLADGFGVEPADEEFKGVVVFVGEAVGFIVLAGFLRSFRSGWGVFFVEDGGEEGGVVAEEAFVEWPVC